MQNVQWLAYYLSLLATLHVLIGILLIRPLIVGIPWLNRIHAYLRWRPLSVNDVKWEAFVFLWPLMVFFVVPMTLLIAFCFYLSRNEDFCECCRLVRHHSLKRRNLLLMHLDEFRPLVRALSKRWTQTKETVLSLPTAYASGIQSELTHQADAQSMRLS